MKRLLLVMGICFSVTLAIVFGSRVSGDALAVIIGVILGVFSSVPTTLLFSYLLARQRPPQNPPPAMPYQPPVIVVNAGDKPGQSYSPGLPALAPPEQGRKWTVIGDSDTN